MSTIQSIEFVKPCHLNDKIVSSLQFEDIDKLPPSKKEILNDCLEVYNNSKQYND